MNEVGHTQSERATLGQGRGKGRPFCVVGTCLSKELKLEMSVVCLGVSGEGVREQWRNTVKALSQDLNAGAPSYSLFTTTPATLF